VETRANYVAVGAFVLAVIVLAFVAVLWLAHTEFGERSNRYYVFFTGSVAGLSKGSQVQYNGISVGRVVDLRVDPNNLEQIQATVEIDTGIVEIKSDARASLETNLLNGIATIQIRGGTRQASNLEPKAGHKYAVIQTERTELEQVKASLPELVSDLKEAAHRVNSVLDEQNRRAVADTLKNLRTLTGAVADHSKEILAIVDNTNATVVELRSLLRDVDQSYISRGGLRDQASQALGDYDRLAKSLLENSHQIQLLIQENRPGIHNFSQHTLAAIDALVSDTQQFVSGLTRLTAEIERDPTRLLFGDRREGYRPQ
jgi:phospholipid/cholesterol/gamma-HCH transport system substrate-binding protein